MVVLAVALVMVVSACAHQPGPLNYGDLPGFFSGVWHGLVLPFAFVASIFTDIRMYAFPNSGVWYDLGLLIGLGAWASAGR
jgi:hypothetical protein